MPFKTSGERIQHMTEVESQPVFVPERYVSKFKTRVQLEYKSCRGSYRTMGRAQEPPPQTTHFLKKHSRKIASANSCKDTSRCLLSAKRPPIPQPPSHEERGRTSSRNFLKENVRRAIRSAPPRPTPKFVDSYKGSIQVVENSGLKPCYVHKKNFGHVPEWFHRYSQTKQTNSQDENSGDRESQIYSKLSEEEKNKILKGLQSSLEEKNQAFLLLPVIIDTPYLINYKRKLEKTIQQLEKDIERIESHHIIYICD